MGFKDATCTWVFLQLLQIFSILDEFSNFQSYSPLQKNTKYAKHVGFVNQTACVLLLNNFSQFWSEPIRSFLQLQMELSSHKLINLDGTIFGIKQIETNLNPFQYKCLDYQIGQGFRYLSVESKSCILHYSLQKMIMLKDHNFWLSPSLP